VANLASYLVLARLDRGGSWSSFGDIVWMGVAQLCAAGALAILLADGTRRLVRKGAEASAHAERVKLNLALVLREHHDLRTDLAAATLNADLAEREVLEPERPGATTRAAALLGELRQAIQKVNRSVASIKERSREELFELLCTRPANVSQAVQQVRAEIGVRFPGCRFEVRLPGDAETVSIAGGEGGLCFVLRNLLVNACEGHAGVAATEVELDTSTVQGRFVMTVRDNGPGFPEPLPQTQNQWGASSKPGGSGLGLSLVRQIVHASGGELELQNPARGGGVVRVVLPVPTSCP
jgi:signal transduction histidine kinase